MRVERSLSESNEGGVCRWYDLAGKRGTRTPSLAMLDGDLMPGRKRVVRVYTVLCDKKGRDNELKFVAHDIIRMIYTEDATLHIDGTHLGYLIPVASQDGHFPHLETPPALGVPSKPPATRLLRRRNYSLYAWATEDL